MPRQREAEGAQRGDAPVDEAGLRRHVKGVEELAGEGVHVLVGGQGRVWEDCARDRGGVGPCRRLEHVAAVA